MSLVDSTNEVIPLKIERPHGVQMRVDVDQDSHVWPEPWVWIDFEHDAEDSNFEPHSYHVTLDEAALLYERLGLILGRPPYLCRGCFGHPHAADGEDPCPGYTCPDCMGSGLYAGSLTEYYQNPEPEKEG